MAELISAIASVATLVVLTAAAVAALIQLRHMRAGNQLAAFNDIYARANDPQMMRLFDLVLMELPEAMRKDPDYAGKVVRREVPSDQSPLRVAFWFDEVGIALRQQLVTEETVFQVGASAFATVAAWRAMQPIIEALRKRSGASFLHFEYAAVRAQRWLDAHPDGDYPKGTPRWSELVEHAASRATQG